MDDQTIELLIDLEEYFDQRQDIVDGDEESGPRPNQAMKFHQQISALLDIYAPEEKE